MSPGGTPSCNKWLVTSFFPQHSSHNSPSVPLCHNMQHIGTGSNCFFSRVHIIMSTSDDSASSAASNRYPLAGRQANQRLCRSWHAATHHPSGYQHHQRDPPLSEETPSTVRAQRGPSHQARQCKAGSAAAASWSCLALMLMLAAGWLFPVPAAASWSCLPLLLAGCLLPAVLWSSSA